MPKPHSAPLSGRKTAGRALPFAERRALLMLGDSLLVTLAVVGALTIWWLVDGAPDWGSFVRDRWVWLPLFPVVWLALGWLFDLYDLMIAGNQATIMRRIGTLIAVAVIGYMLIYFFAPIQTLPRLFVLYFGLLAALVTIPWRWSYARLLTLPRFRQRIIIVGTGPAGQALGRILDRQEGRLCDIVGYVDDDVGRQVEGGPPVLGPSTALFRLAQQHQVDRIVVAATGRHLARALPALVDCRARGLCVLQMPDLYEQLTRRLPVEHIDMSWVLTAMDDLGIWARVDQLLRRILDLILGLVGLIALLLVLPFIALAIAFDDAGPLFYTQIRSGLASRPFCILKFRTMRPDAEKDGAPQWATQEDHRVTRVGRFLRRTRLDELPQVINILRGEMAIVGPRPERPELIADLEREVPYYPARLMVKPGLTGWAQIHYDYGNTTTDALVKLQYDLYYIRHRAVWLDLYIIAKTLVVVLRMGGI